MTKGENMGIPKIIHFCWFGYGQYSEMIKNCIKSWSEILPEYQIMLWNEESFDVSSCVFTQEAYQHRKWAFVSDYVRLYVLEKYGGVYLDTDVEVIKDFTEVLKGHKFVSSFTEGGLIATSFLASVPHGEFVRKLLEYYNSITFVSDEGALDMCMNPLIFSAIATKSFGLDMKKDACFLEDISIFPMEYFQPYRKNIFGRVVTMKKFHITSNTYIIHKDMGSWGKDDRISQFIKGSVRLVMPKQLYLYIKTKTNKKNVEDILQKKMIDL